MMISLILSVTAGMVLGQRFKVLILLPASGLAIIAATAAGIARGDHAWSITLLAVAVTVALQIGYLVGTGIQSFLYLTLRRSRPNLLQCDLAGGRFGVAARLTGEPEILPQRSSLVFGAEEPASLQLGHDQINEFPQTTR
jgi:hypothetical protein